MSKNINVPKLRFKEFTKGWEEKKFEDIFNFSIGKNIKQNEASPDFEIPCVRYGELYHMYSEVISKVINKTNLDKSELLFSDGDEILMPSAGEDPLDIGLASALTLKNVAIGRTINILKPLKENIYSQIFVSYYINEKLRKKISTLAKGSSISNVYNSDLKQLKLKLPILDEQEKIALFLSSVNKKIEKLTKKDELLQQYKKSIMQKIFSQEIRFKDNYGSKFPEWKKRIISEYINHIGGTALEKYVSDESEYKFISIGNYSVHGKYIDNGQRVLLNEKTKTKLLNKNDLVMVLNDKTSIGDIIGSTILVDKNNTYIYNQRSERIICNNDILPIYLWHYFNSTQFRKKVFSLAQGGTQIYINFSSIKFIETLIPCLEEQKKIANFLSSIDDKIEENQKILEKTKEFKKSLLQQMFV
ncbi:restriction endonuclease subunit S [Aliarcobacter butzleri]|uniref:restriction endonuclease subunit S n=1 Tax=Aliarcobacter butzleri TaxID=28197 RepID=UPI001D007A0D|nr:restriction endonuclease subunit S [Aliarcobacter butzleri]